MKLLAKQMVPWDMTPLCSVQPERLHTKALWAMYLLSILCSPITWPQPTFPLSHFTCPLLQLNNHLLCQALLVLCCLLWMPFLPFCYIVTSYPVNSSSLKPPEHCLQVIWAHAPDQTTNSPIQEIDLQIYSIPTFWESSLLHNRLRKVGWIEEWLGSRKLFEDHGISWWWHWLLLVWWQGWFSEDPSQGAPVLGSREAGNYEE